MSVNKVILIGNTGKDPEVRYLESGAVVANVTLATSEKWKDNSGNVREATEWHDLEIWNNPAKVFEQHVKKGDKLYIEGSIKTESWSDEQGNTRKRTKIRVQSFQFLGSKTQSGSSQGQSQGSPSPRQAPAAQPAFSNAPDYTLTPSEVDDLPF